MWPRPWSIVLPIPQHAGRVIPRRIIERAPSASCARPDRPGQPAAVCSSRCDHVRLYGTESESAEIVPAASARRTWRAWWSYQEKRIQAPPGAGRIRITSAVSARTGAIRSHPGTRRNSGVATAGKDGRAGAAVPALILLFVDILAAIATRGVRHEKIDAIVKRSNSTKCVKLVGNRRKRTYRDRGQGLRPAKRPYRALSRAEYVVDFLPR